MQTLDSFNPKPQYICDYEGHELFILQGSIDTIIKYGPIIQLVFQKSRMENLKISPHLISDLLHSPDFVQINTPTDPGEIIVVPRSRLNEIYSHLNEFKHKFSYNFTITQRIGSLLSSKL
jgi:hypothetical protein